MTASFTPNVQMVEPARGDDVGTWDTPVNANITQLDLMVGGIATISLNNSPIVLSAAQFQAKQITFNSTLTGSIAITFPTSFTKSYEIQNLCTGSSAFVITLGTTAGGQVICCPPGEIIDCFNDGSNIKFKNLDRIGAYWDYAGSSVPAWVSGCSVPPYLNCNGTTFSSATYPILSLILGGTTLPDSRSKGRVPLDQGAGLLSSSVVGFSPNTVGASGGSQATMLSSLNLPKMIDPSHQHPASIGIGVNSINIQVGSASNVILIQSNGSGQTIPATTTGITYGSSSQTSFSALQPTFVGGLCLIRAA